MKKERKPIQKKEPANGFLIKIDYRERRRLEMKRRMGVLHHKRICLEQELLAIKGALISLDQQMQRDQAFEKLST